MAADLLQTIERFWEARLAGDKAAVQGFLSPEATYEMVGAKTFADQKAVGPSSARAAAEQLIDDFRFHSRERVTALVEGSRVAMVSRFQVSFRGGAPVDSEACDLWEFDDAGKVVSLKQFVDTDLVRRMTNGLL